MESQAKIKTKDFLRHIKLLAQNSSDRIVDGFHGTEKDLIKRFTADASDLIEHGAWGIGLEYLLNNIYEIEFRVDKRAIELAKDAIDECGMEYKDWIFIEELVK